jgi:dephospho-CoA kinase
MLRRLGATVVDADDTAHRVMEPGNPAWKKIVARFGRRILRHDGYIDRQALGAEVFSDSEKLRKLCAILHPEVYKKMRAIVSRTRKADSSAVVVLDVPLLLETGGQKYIDKLIVVSAPREVQIGRACRKFGLKRAQIVKRIRMQMPLSRKVKAADFVVDNGGSIVSTEKQVRAIWKKLAGA